MSCGPLSCPPGSQPLGPHLRAHTCWLERAINFFKKNAVSCPKSKPEDKNIILPPELPGVTFDLIPCLCGRRHDLKFSSKRSPLERHKFCEPRGCFYRLSCHSPMITHTGDLAGIGTHSQKARLPPAPFLLEIVMVSSEMRLRSPPLRDQM